jgi:carbon monoxide dehydrogenase subunit G
MRWFLYAVGGLVGLILLGVLALALLGLRPGAGVVTSQIEIERPPQEIWPWLTEGEKIKQWVSWLVEVHDLTPGVEGVGARTRWVLIDPNLNDQRVEIFGECTAWEPPLVSTMRLESPEMFTGTATHRLVDLGEAGARLEYESEFRMSHWAARLFEPLVTPQARKKAEDDMAKLKELAESALAPLQEGETPAEARR